MVAKNPMMDDELYLLLWLMDHLTFKMVFPSQTPTLGTRKQERIDLKDDLKDGSIHVNFNDKNLR